jgi:hypothetical protein
MNYFWSALGLLALVLPSWAGEPASTAANVALRLPPFQVQAGGKPLDVEHVGHAAPFVGDFFEDGKLALLVGQYQDGRLRIYRNTGTPSRPQFDSYIWFEAGGKVASVPYG